MVYVIEIRPTIGFTVAAGAMNPADK